MLQLGFKTRQKLMHLQQQSRRDHPARLSYGGCSRFPGRRTVAANHTGANDSIRFCTRTDFDTVVFGSDLDTSARKADLERHLWN